MGDNSFLLSSAAIAEDGTLYIGNRDNNLYAFTLNGNLAWSFPTAGDIFSSPTIADDGTVYVSSRGSLYALYGSAPLCASCPWPKFKHDLKNTGNNLTQ